MNNNVTGAQQVVSTFGVSTLLALLSCGDEKLETQAAQSLMIALQSVENPTEIFLENSQLLGNVCSLFCKTAAPQSVRECISFILTRLVTCCIV